MSSTFLAFLSPSQGYQPGYLKLPELSHTTSMAPRTTEKRVRLNENDNALTFGDDIPEDVLQKLRGQFGDDPVKGMSSSRLLI